MFHIYGPFRLDHFVIPVPIKTGTFPAKQIDREGFQTVFLPSSPDAAPAS